MTKQEAITEVAHLTRLDHAHILRVIGTYVKGRELSILLYPVANCNLERFLERYRQTSTSDLSGRETFLKNCFPCLSSAVRYIHRKLTKHMDIKPQNILVLRKSYATRTLFIADFGIARSYATLEDVETDGKTSFTKRYAAPEVIKQELRGLPADMFSLGCVFIEVYDALYGREVWYQRGSGLQACLDAGFQGDTSYQSNIEAIQADLSKFTKKYWDYVPSPSLMVEMLRHNPAERPTAEQLVATLGERSCCRGGSIALRPVGKEPHEMDIDDI
jgi:serine/threonine protein kinase